MLVKRAATLQNTLGLKGEPPANGIAWHQLLTGGLAFLSFQAVAKELKLKDARLAEHLGLSSAQLAARKKSRQLGANESDLLYGIAAAYVKLAGFKGTDAARQWLTSPCEALKGLEPLNWLRTRLGTEYVLTAIERMRPPPLRARAEPEDSADEEEAP